MPAELVFVAGVLGIVSAVFAVWRAVQPTVRRGDAAFDAILGEPEVLDRAGKVLRSAQPGLVARTATLELAVATLVDQETRIASAEHILKIHEARLAGLEQAGVERIVTKAESAQMWRAVADRDVDES